MTQQECDTAWLTEGNPAKLVDLVVHPHPRVRKYTNRKFCLWSCACCRRIWHLLTLTHSHEAVEHIERYADGLEVPESMREVERRLWRNQFEHDTTLREQGLKGLASRHNAFQAVAFAVRSCRGPEKKVSVNWGLGAVDISTFISRAVYAAAQEEDGAILHRPIRPRTPEDAAMCDLLRDVFGNPFRPVTFAPEWRTDTAIAIAKGMYEPRDFGAMPILADALQDAGCDNDDVLNHCRDANGVHVRGCWVVDLVLGKA